MATVLVVILAALPLRSMLERALRERIESAAARHGMVARIGVVHLGIWPFLRMDGFDLALGHDLNLHADTVAAAWPGRLRLAVGGLELAGPGGLRVSAPVTAWDVGGMPGGDRRLTLVEPQSGLSIHGRGDRAGSAWDAEARGLDFGRLFKVERDSRPLFDGGIADGRLEFQSSADALRFRVAWGARGARLGALAVAASDEPVLGNPTDLTVGFEGTWRRAEGTIEIPAVHATVAGAALTASLSLQHLGTDPLVDLALAAQRLDFAQLLRTSGIEVPGSLGLAPGAATDLGTAAIDLRVRGRPSDPASLSVSQKVAFTPPRRMPPAIERLRSDFVFAVDSGSRGNHPIEVSPASADFIALRDVPPLLVRSLLLAEDNGFYGHPGIDLRELPSALLTDWSRGGAARGASTLTQQLAKNLFLSREKQLGRKLQELVITFLLESALGKDRILEIYLNIIEWGPDLHGLRPAARAYFGREPRDLTPAEMAFLVEIIPGPIKYQSSFAHGTPGPGLRALIDALLAKLRSVHAIGEEDYRRALEEPLVVTGNRPPGRSMLQ